MSETRARKCIDQPISWLELELHALGESQRPQEIDEHLSACDACQEVMRSIDEGVQSMPALEIPAAASASPRWRTWRWSFALAPALLLLFVLLREGSAPSPQGTRSKGGDPSFELIRERDGQLLQPTHFRPGDRFKLRLSCAGGKRAVDLVVQQAGQLFYPWPATRVSCGNDVVVPGAFSLSGGPARVCLVLSGEEPPVRGAIPDDALCTGLAPEL